MKNKSKLNFLAILTIVAMAALMLPMQIIAQSPPPRPGQQTPTPPPRPGQTTQPAQPVLQWATNLPTNVDVLIQTVVAPNNSTAAFWNVRGSSGWQNGTQVYLWDVGNAERNSRFRFEHQGDGWYVIRSNAHGVFDIPQGGVNNNGTQPTVWQANSQNNQRFRFREVGNGEYAIQTFAGKYIHVEAGNNTNNGRAIVIWDGEGAMNTKWRIWTVESNTRSIWTSQGRGLSVQLTVPPPRDWVTNLPGNVDVVFQTTRTSTTSRNGIWSAQHSDSRNGSVIHLWDFTGQQNSIFRLHHMGDGWYVITNKVRGAVDIQGGRDDNGVAMVIWDRHDGGGQRFRVNRVSEGVFEFHTMHNRTLNLQNGNTNNGNRIHTWRSSENDQNNKFRILRVGDHANLNPVR